MTSENEPLNVPQMQPNHNPQGADTPMGSTAPHGSRPHPRQGTPGATSQSVPGQMPGIPTRPNPDSQKKAYSRRGLIIGLGIAVIVVVVAVLVWMFACGGLILDQNAREGQAPYKTAEEIQAELDRTVEEGMFNISIASVIEFPDGTGDGVAYIENVPGNRYNMKVVITDDDTGDVLYESGILKPNQYIETIKLNKDLEQGSYPATATFTALDQSNNEEIGKAAAKVTIDVKG